MSPLSSVVGSSEFLSALARPPTRTAGDDLLTITKCVRQRGVRLPRDRHRLFHVLAGIAERVQLRFGGRALPLAGARIVGEAAWHRGIGDREIETVAGAHANGMIGAGRGAIAAWTDYGTAAEEGVEETLRSSPWIGGCGVLRATIV